MTADSARRPMPDPEAAGPRHALSFDMEAVHLMEREGEEWAWRGAARFDTPDLAGRLATLRRGIDGLKGPGPGQVALIIPDDQVLFTEFTVDPDLPRRAAVAAGLDGLTPYAVDDLAFDWVDAAPDRVRVAAVWRQTLSEAEAFAAGHGFKPIAALADAEGTHLARPVQFIDVPKGKAVAQADKGSAEAPVDETTPSKVAEQASAPGVGAQGRVPLDEALTRIRAISQPGNVNAPDVTVGSENKILPSIVEVTSQAAHDAPVADVSVAVIAEEKAVLSLAGPATPSDAERPPRADEHKVTEADPDKAVAEAGKQSDADADEGSGDASYDAKEAEAQVASANETVTDTVVAQDRQNGTAATPQEVQAAGDGAQPPAEGAADPTHALQSKGVTSAVAKEVQKTEDVAAPEVHDLIGPLPSPQPGDADSLPPTDGGKGEAVTVSKAHAPEVTPVFGPPAPSVAVIGSSAQAKPDAQKVPVFGPPPPSLAKLDPSADQTLGPKTLVAPMRSAAEAADRGWQGRVAPMAAALNRMRVGFSAKMRDAAGKTQDKGSLAVTAASRPSKVKTATVAPPAIPGPSGPVPAELAGTPGLVPATAAVAIPTERPKNTAAPDRNAIKDARAKAFHERANQARAAAVVPRAPAAKAAAPRLTPGQRDFYLMLALLVLGLLAVFLFVPSGRVPALVTAQQPAPAVTNAGPAETTAAEIPAEAPTATEPASQPAAIETATAVAAPAATIAETSEPTAPAEVDQPAAAPDTAEAATTATTPPANPSEPVIADTPSAPAATEQPVTAASPPSPEAAPAAAAKPQAPASDHSLPATAQPAASPAPARVPEAAQAATPAAPRGPASNAAAIEEAVGLAVSQSPSRRPAAGQTQDTRRAPVAPARPAAGDASPRVPRDPLPFDRAREAEPSPVTGIRPPSRPPRAPAEPARTVPAAAPSAATPPAAAKPAAAVKPPAPAAPPARASRPRSRPAAAATPAAATTAPATELTRPTRREGALTAEPAELHLASLDPAPLMKDWLESAFRAVPDSPSRGAFRVGLANDRALFVADVRGPRTAQARPPSRDDAAPVPPIPAKKPAAKKSSGGSSPKSAVDAALAAAAADDAPKKAAPTASAAKGRPGRRPGASGTSSKAVESAIADAIEQSPASPGGVALKSLKSSPFPERAPRAAKGTTTPKPADKTDDDAAALAVAAAAAARPSAPATPDLAPAQPAAPDPDAADAARRAERLRLDEQLQRQAEERIRARAQADARIEAQQRAAAEARARAQAAAEARTAAARGQRVAPVEGDNEPDVAGPVGGGSTSATIASNATLRGIDLSRTTLIGVIGAGPASRGLIRLRNGKIVTVRLGDRIDGGPITSIGKGAVTYVKGGRPYQLLMLAGR
ncbi:hypothetical protein DRW48_13850 [Paracoccus suum]|uniref:Translation initiation factor 2 n=1 Tax=Paracoccus suum TaxID=2259340 RepID=A0A344PMM0_9RHOB|nr:hypothetical protein [Paracoccus suum]AXC50625.1 hypothetical protein DRW48_13850 [Paracoccus suum]